jgi:hypothetical protein
MQIILPQQILVPKKVYIGDTAELRCTFNSPEPVLKTLTANGAAELAHNFYNTEDFEIKEIKLLPAGVDFYQLSITFVPWKTGSIQFDPLVLEDSLTIEFQPVQIVSLISTDAANTTTLHDTAAPLLLPGTAYKLYGTLAASVLLLIIIIRLIVKRKNILFFINQRRLLRKYKKNRKQAVKLLRQSETAEQIQKIMRHYLEVRFDYPFTRSVTSEMMKGWQEATGGLLSDEKTEAFGEIVSSFIRTDFIRYSKGGKFKDGELEELVKSLLAQIDILEKEGEANA